MFKSPFNGTGGNAERGVSELYPERCGGLSVVLGGVLDARDVGIGQLTNDASGDASGE